ncbi:hypothetical protein [Blastopirellula marina]|uniref:Uncharacterized protein n=1 Tax=Blastopirellula marina TaxID=124 RepID=A0A2S8GI91_9BACT|nr:hypothetical protein [Blastopirellula marina]PQO43744.1 hypothetical protein C5Y93_24230 [Blastopirellula marina]
MSGIVLVACAVVCGADVRETIPSVAALYDVIDQSRQLSVYKDDYRVLKDGAVLEALQTRGSTGGILDKLPSRGSSGIEPLSKGELRVVPIPNHPNLLLAGYVTHHESPITYDYAWREANLLLDVDRNVVIWWEQRNAVPHFLSKEQTAALNADLLSAAKAWGERIARRRDLYPTEPRLQEFDRQFVDPPPVEVSCKAVSVDVVSGECEFQFRLSGGGQTAEFPYKATLLDLLASELAMPAEQYFAAAKTEESK